MELREIKNSFPEAPQNFSIDADLLNVFEQSINQYLGTVRLIRWK